jgi:hypothetical protein
MQRHLDLVRGLIVAASVCALPAAAGAATVTEHFDRTFPLAADGTLHIKNVNGAIVIEPWERQEVRVEADKETRGGSDDQAQQLMKELQIVVTPGSGSLSIETKVPHANDGLFAWLFGGGSHHKVEYHLHVPQRVAVDAHSVNGGVSLTGTRGKALLETTNGSLAVDRVDGALQLETTNGNIKVREAAGAVHAETTNGSVAAELSRVDAALSLESTNGSLTLRLPREIRATVDADTTNGSITTDLPVTTTSAGKRHLKGNINGGGPELHLSTTNGSVHIAVL